MGLSKTGIIPKPQEVGDFVSLSGTDKNSLTGLKSWQVASGNEG